MSEKVTVSALVNGGIGKVWDYYNNPAHIVNWNFADPSWQCPSASNDLRPGGKYQARMEAKDGSFGFDFEAVYDQVDEGKSFSYTMPNGRQAGVVFTDRGDQTEVDVSFDPETENPVEFQKAGWQAILNNFKSYTEAN